MSRTGVGVGDGWWGRQAAGCWENGDGALVWVWCVPECYVTAASAHMALESALSNLRWSGL